MTDDQPREATGVQAGIDTNQQLRIALETMIANNGTATIQQIYAAVEAQMRGIRLSQSGKDSLRYVVKNLGVQRGFIQPFDRQRPGWHITQAGRTFAANPVSYLSTPRVHNVPLFYAAAERFVDAALRHDDSLFTPGRPIWSRATLNDLYARFVEQPDKSGDTFMVKLERQLADAPPATVQLAAEALYVYFLVPRDTRGDTKRKQIREVLGWSAQPVGLPAELTQALDQGIARTGIAYKTFKPFQLWFLLTMVREWKGLAAEQREQYLDDPWAFKGWLWTLPVRSAYAMREALLHMVHPDSFESIVSGDHKRQYAEQYRQSADPPTDDVDRQLFAIRQRLAERYGPTFMFYNLATLDAELEAEDTVLPRSLGDQLRPYVEMVARLDPTPYTPDELIDWLGRRDPPLVDWQQIARPDPLTLVSDLLLLRLLEPLNDGTYRRWPHLADGELETMLRYAALTLLVPHADDDGYRLPILHAPFDGTPHPVDAWPLGEPLLRWYEEAGLVQPADEGLWQSQSDALQPLDKKTPTAQAINTFLRHLRQVQATQSTAPDLNDAPLPHLDPAVLEQRIAEIQRHLLIDRTTLLRIYRALLIGHHVVLSGPPGTGKTHLARLLPSILWRESTAVVHYELPTDPQQPPTAPPQERVRSRNGYTTTVVTATEDWGVRNVIGGIAPQLRRNGNATSLSYTVQYGHLTQALLANYSGYNPETLEVPAGWQRTEVVVDDTVYRGRWLIIDEFTRARIDSAFGSLLTALSGQGDATVAVPTVSGQEQPVPLPRDFRIIATLNSFDRHFLNQISEAMKRRFTFIDILPPAKAYAAAERGIALYRALGRLAEHQFPGVSNDDDLGVAAWADILTVTRTPVSEQHLAVHYVIQVDTADAAQALESFWRIFWAIRVYRQLGTAQAEAVLAATLGGRSIGLDWPTALDTALADVLGDQMQVLGRDEQRVVLAYLRHAADAAAFVHEVQAILGTLPPPRQQAHLTRLRTAGAALPEPAKPADLDMTALAAVFNLGTGLIIDADGAFADRIRAFINELGL